MSARIVSRAQLHYADGPDAALDRPAHVRAGSGLRYVDTVAGPRLVLDARAHVLGNVGGVRLTFTDACARDGTIYVTAAAEACLFTEREPCARNCGPALQKYAEKMGDVNVTWSEQVTKEIVDAARSLLK